MAVENNIKLVIDPDANHHHHHHHHPVLFAFLKFGMGQVRGGG
jgi:hypothetical protein